MAHVGTWGCEHAANFTIAKATATVSLGDLIQVYDGSAKSATATTNPPSLTVDFTYDPASPTQPGDYSVSATVNDPNYTGTASGTLKILAKHTITLVPGWNLVSFNLQPYPSAAPADVLASLGDNYDLVYAWDATGLHSGDGHWMKYDRTSAPYANSLTSMAETQGFWIHDHRQHPPDPGGSRLATYRHLDRPEDRRFGLEPDRLPIKRLLCASRNLCNGKRSADLCLSCLRNG